MRRTDIFTATLLVLSLAADGAAQSAPRDLALATLEDLLQIEITTVSRKRERAKDVAAAIYVITRRDIRRSGLTSVPELFRLVPGMTVSQINSNNWAISVRGFGSLFSNKLLVLVDGRSIYNRTFSGEFWNSLDLPLDEIERIEVIRGPGGSVWGANSVNGVINIITRSAAKTQGLYVKVGAGTYDAAQGAVRYGGTIGGASYRLYSQFSSRGSSLVDRNTAAADNWNSLTNGFRVDWAKGADSVIVEGGLVTGEARPLWRKLASPLATPQVGNSAAVTRNGTLLGRWTRNHGNRSSLQVQAFVDLRHRDDGDVDEEEHVYDVHAQYQTPLWARHDFVTGGGYRHVDSRLDGSFAFSLNPAMSESEVVNAFVQDDIALADRVRVTLGSKLEHDNAYGWNVQPTVRAMWHVVPGTQRLWASASRAVRTPSSVDRSGTIRYAAFTGSLGLPVVLGIVGNPNYRPEHVLSIESGYRAQMGSRAAVDVTVYRGHYDHLQTNEPTAPVFVRTPAPAHMFVATEFQNLLDADTQGLELSAHWRPLNSWRIEGSFSTFRLTPHLDPASRDQEAGRFDGNAPGMQWQIRSTADIGSKVEVTASVFHTGPLQQLGVAAHTRADARVAVRVISSLSVVGTGQNLFDGAHAEYGGFEGVVPTLIPRSGNLQLIWRF